MKMGERGKGGGGLRRDDPAHGIDAWPLHPPSESGSPRQSPFLKARSSRGHGLLRSEAPEGGVEVGEGVGEAERGG